MKKALILGLLSLGLAGCANTAPTQNTTAIQTQPANNSSIDSMTRRGSDNSMTSLGHGTKPEMNAPMQNAPKSDASNPMAKSADVSSMNADIEKAEKAYKEKSSDAKAKEDLAKAYFARAFALTEAAQYRAALGDFRKGLKLDPNNLDAKSMHDQIIDIFKSMGREPPKEGEEPAPNAK